MENKRISDEKLFILKALWMILQISQIIYIASWWIVVRAYLPPIQLFTFEHEKKEDPPLGSSEIVQDDQDEILEYQFFCEKSTEIFGLMWFSLISVAVTISLILTLRHNRTRTILGFFVGVSATMANWTLIYAVKSSQILMEKKNGGKGLYQKSAVEVSSFLGFFLTVLYVLFSVLLFSWIEDIAEEESSLKGIYLGEDEEDNIWTDIPIAQNRRNRNNTSPTVTSTSESVIQG